MNPVIVVIEDDHAIADYMEQLLIDNRFKVYIEHSGAAGLKLIEQVMPELVLLDLHLPDISGETICKQVKKDNPEIKVIMITAKDTPEDIAKGLNLGADDYIPKPISPEELLARVNARLRSTPQTTDVLKIDSLILNVNTHEVKRGNKSIELSPQEFKLLEYFMTSPNQVLTREMILSRIWGSSPDIETRVVDVYVGYLRKKIENGATPKLLHSVRGFGYMLKAPEKIALAN